MEQLTLFELPDLSILNCDNWKSLAKSDETVEIAFLMLKGLKIEDWAALNQIIQLRFDFDTAQQTFDSSGSLFYVREFKIFDKEITVFEYGLDCNTNLWIGDNCINIFKWTEKDEFGKKVENKIRQGIRKKLYSKKSQIEYLINN